MPANVETMFSVRETPWHGLGRIIMDAPASREALELAGLDWQVESRYIYSSTGAMIPGYRANVRSTDDAVLGVVSDRYRIVQNEEAFQFTDDLLGEGVTYETAGSLQGGKKVWMLARLPRKYLIAGDQVVPYLVIFNSHDGSSGVKVAMTPIRVVCQNTLNLALNTAQSAAGLHATPKMFCCGCRMPVRPCSWPATIWLNSATVAKSWLASIYPITRCRSSSMSFPDF